MIPVRYPVRGAVPAAPAPIEAGLMTSPIRGDFMIHVDVETILANRANRRHDPVIKIRNSNLIETVREVSWIGPSRFVHHEFMRIPGSKVQNWIETDADLTCWCDHDGMTVMPAQPDIVRERKPVAPRIKGKFIIHIAAPVLARNRKEGRDDPVIAIRSAETDWATDVLFCRKVEWEGPARMVHRPTTPIPGTDGRGISFVETDAPLTVYLDNQPPTIMYDAVA